MQPVNEAYSNISYTKFAAVPQLNVWMRSGGGILTMLAVLILTFPVSIFLLPLLVWMRGNFYRTLGYKLDADEQMLVIERKGKTKTMLDLRRVTDIEFKKNGNIFLHSTDRLNRKTKLFSVDNSAFTSNLQVIHRRTQPATQADFHRRHGVEQAVYGG